MLLTNLLSLSRHLRQQVVQIVRIQLIDHSGLRILDDSGSSHDRVICASGSWKRWASVEADSRWNVRWIVNRCFHILVWISISASNRLVSSIRILRGWPQILAFLFKSLNFLILFDRSLVYLVACLALDRTFAIQLLGSLSLRRLLILGSNKSGLSLGKLLLPSHIIFFPSSWPSARAQGNIYRRLPKWVARIRVARVH